MPSRTQFEFSFQKHSIIERLARLRLFEYRIVEADCLTKGEHCTIATSFCFKKMFYPAEFMYLARRGKLAKCWLAATTSEQRYKKVFGLTSIKSINISALCDEILETVEIRPNRPYGQRFSLYLSSQLMYGTVKILLYQTTTMERQLFDIKRQLRLEREIIRHGMETDTARIFELPDLPSVSQDFRNAQLDENLHLISDEPNLNAGMELLMHAEHLNFGILTDDDLEYMLMLGGHSPEESMYISGRKETGVSSSKLLPDDQESFMKDVMIEESKVGQAPSDDPKDIQRETLIGVEDIVPEMDHQPAQESLITRAEQQIRLSLTPQKRRTSELQIDTPTKRRRLTFEDAQPEPQPPVAAEDTSALVLEQPDIQYTATKVERRRAARKMIDKKIEIEDKKFKLWISNVMAHIESQSKIQLNIPPAAALLQMPTKSMQTISGKNWAKDLHSLFDSCIQGMIFKKPEVVTSTNVEVEQLRWQETVRVAELTDKTIDVAELSAGVADIVIETTHSKTLERTGSDMIEIQPLSPIKPDLQEKPYDDVHMENVTIKETESSSNQIQNGQLTKQDLLAMLEIYWHDKEIITFNEVISPSSYTASDAARAFKFLLEFHSENKLVLKQRESYAPIWIQKCMY